MEGISVLWVRCLLFFFFFLCCATEVGAPGSTVTLENISVMLKQKFDELDEFLQTSVSQSFDDMQFELDIIKSSQDSLKADVEEMGNQSNTKVEEMGTQMNTKFEELHDRMTTMEEMGNQLNTKVEEMGTQMNTKFEELEGKMDIMQGQLAELQGSSNVEGVLQLCADTMEMEREFQREVINQTCNNNMDQIANLQESFSTELETIDRSIKGCSSKVSNLQELLTSDVDKCRSTGENSCHRYAVCNNHPGGYTCTCDPGYSGNGFNCEDVDECSSTGENLCHRDAVCNNIPGGYTCTCNRGFYGDGFNCQSCGTDFTDVPGVGCLKAIHEYKTFDDASTHCSTLDAQLVVTQNFQALQDYVDSLLFNMSSWIGVRDRKWMDGRDVGPEEWRSGQPDGDVNECGYIYSNGIRDTGCKSTTLWFICQLKHNAP